MRAYADTADICGVTGRSGGEGVRGNFGLIRTEISIILDISAYVEYYLISDRVTNACGARNQEELLRELFFIYRRGRKFK